MTKFLSALSVLLLVVATPAGALTLAGTLHGSGHTPEPAVLALVGAGFFLVGFIRRRTAGD